MGQKSARPEGMPWITPYLCVSDIEAAVNFYRDAFGFTLHEKIMRDDDGNAMHAEMRYNDCMIMMGAESLYNGATKTPKNSGTQSPVSICVYCDDVDQFFAHATEVGAKTVCEPEDMFWGDRMCRLTDPDGHAWSFATNVKPCNAGN